MTYLIDTFNQTDHFGKDPGQYEGFKGIYYLSPLTIPLSLAILVQNTNTFIIMNYWERR